MADTDKYRAHTKRAASAERLSGAAPAHFCLTPIDAISAEAVSLFSGAAPLPGGRIRRARDGSAEAAPGRPFSLDARCRDPSPIYGLSSAGRTRTEHAPGAAPVAGDGTGAGTGGRRGRSRKPSAHRWTRHHAPDPGCRGQQRVVVAKLLISCYMVQVVDPCQPYKD